MQAEDFHRADQRIRRDGGCGSLGRRQHLGDGLAGLAIAGIGVGPTLVTEFSLGAERSPVGRSATVMTILGSSLILGQSLASAVNGALAENVGTAAAQCAPLVAALVVLGAGIANAVLSRRQSAAAGTAGDQPGPFTT